jgi:hypothetical protein
VTTVGRIRAFLIAMMVGAFGVPWAVASPLSLSPELAHPYAFDSPHSRSATTHNIIERGRPGPTSLFVTDDLGMRRVSTRSLVAWKVVPTTYDQLAQHLESPRSRAFNDGQASTAEVDPFVRQRSRVAAKAVPEVVGPARSTDLVLDSFRGLGPGTQKTVRTVGSVDEMRATFDAWSVGAERLPARGTKVPDVYRLPDGGVIQWRTGSTTGGPAIDIFPPGGAARTVHLADGVPW